MKSREEILSGLKGGVLSKILEKVGEDDCFCVYLHAFYNFYLSAECLGKVDIFMDGVGKVADIVVKGSKEKGG